MRDNGRKRSNFSSIYSMDGFPPNYSGQYTNIPDIEEEIEKDDIIHEKPEKQEELRIDKEPLPPPTEKKEKSLLGSLFGGSGDGFLSKLFGNKDKDGGFFKNIDLEDLILIGVLFFLLKDGADNDILIIIAIILFL